MKSLFQLLVLLAVPALAMAQVAPRVQPLSGEEQTIYKHVDAAGKVTYSNAPIKGGNRVVLDALTVIPSTPSGSLRAPEEQAIAETPAALATKPLPARAAKVGAKTTNIPGAQQVATVTTMPSLKASAVLAEIAPARAPTPAASPVVAPTSMEALAQKRREEVRRRLLQTELDNEEQMLNEARAQLALEQKQSATIRAMRASIAASTADATKPAVLPEARATVERHFERVRDLQDQISTHERNLEDFRQQLRAESLRVAKGQ